jgi:Flp pilus assembly protein TadG
MIMKLFHMRGDSRGSAAVEFAITLPILVVIVIGIIDYASAVNLSTKLYNGARAAAQYALYHPGDASGTSSGAAAAAQNATSDTSMTVSSVTTTCKCINSSTGVVSTTATVCTSTCGAGFTLGHFLTVTTQQTFTPTIALSRLAVIGGTGITSSTLKGSAQIQVQ